MPNLLARLIPYIFLGVMIVLLVLGMILLSYLLIVGAILGLVLFLIGWIRDKLFHKKPSDSTPFKHKPGRTIDHHDL